MNILGYDDESNITNDVLVSGNIQLENRSKLIIKEVDIYEQVVSTKDKQRDDIINLQEQINKLKKVILQLTNIDLND